MAAVAYPSPHPRQVELRPPLRLVRGSARPSEAVYRRRRVAAVLLAACVLVALASAVVVWRGATSSTVVQTAAGPDAVVADPAAYGSAHAQPPPGSVYVVQPGDTLWSIARKLVPEGDVRAEVDRLADLNGTAALQAGQRLQLASPSGP